MTATQRPETASAQRLIIVGVDGSEPSKAALAWALANAHGAAVEAVYVYEPPSVTTWFVGAQPVVVPAPDTFHGLAVEALQTAVADTIKGTGAEVAEIVAAGSPARILAEYGAKASLLVLGAHVTHGFGRLLGSTAVACVRHAPCPVVVVPVDWADHPAAATKSLVPAT